MEERNAKYKKALAELQRYGIETFFQRSTRRGEVLVNLRGYGIE